jgi:hypothetical protein
VVAPEHRYLQGRAALSVGRVHLRAELDEEGEHGVVQQQRHHRLVARPRRPAEDVGPVEVAVAVHVGVGVEQDPGAVEVPAAGRPPGGRCRTSPGSPGAPGRHT